MTSCSTNEFSLAIFPIVNSEFLYKVRFAPESCQSLNSVESTALADDRPISTLQANDGNGSFPVIHYFEPVRQHQA